MVVTVRVNGFNLWDEYERCEVMTEFWCRPIEIIQRASVLKIIRNKAIIV